ncbi:MAG: RNA-binding S4 domain-containing protein [Oscillospiraceae bacterium]|nr:RNA-binding S4 domain-containing protein [Oscillospiraceae bacterium]
MRIDKYLKVSRLIKRRTVANEACDGGRVTINGKVAKPGSEVKAGDILELRFGERLLKVRVEDIKEHVMKNDAALMYTVLENN